jgi:large subunit ribosomal protein L16
VAERLKASVLKTDKVFYLREFKSLLPDFLIKIIDYYQYMIIFPFKSKFKKHQKGSLSFDKKEQRYILPKKGFFGIKILKSIRLKSNQIEAARKAIRKRIKKKYKVKPLLIGFSDRIATRKSSGVRMGKGKGSLDFWYFFAKSGRIVFELNKKIPKTIAEKAFRAAGFKFSSSIKIISRFKNLS